MKIFTACLLVLFAAATTSSVILYNRWKHSNREVHTLSINGEVLQKKIAQDPPEWMVRQIRKDLSPYASGIAREILDQGFRGDKIWQYSLVRFQISDGHITFSHDEKNLYARHFRELLACIKKLNQHVKLPNVDFIVSLEDGFAENPGIGPVFVFAKTKEEKRLILIPDINALAGYREIREAIPKANHKMGWDQKIAKCFWRGSSTGGYSTLANWNFFARAKLVLMSLTHPQKLDARFHHVVQSDAEVLSLMKAKGMVAPSVSRPDHLKYKYLVDVDGNSCSYERYFWLLLSNSLVIKQITPNIQWYYGGLEPYKHFLPVKEDLSDLMDVIQWASEHDEECRLMAERATEFVEKNLTPEDTLLYLYLLLKEYAQLQI